MAEFKTPLLWHGHHCVCFSNLTHMLSSGNISRVTQRLESCVCVRVYELWLCDVCFSCRIWRSRSIRPGRITRPNCKKGSLSAALTEMLNHGDENTLTSQLIQHLNEDVWIKLSLLFLSPQTDTCSFFFLFLKKRRKYKIWWLKSWRFLASVF